MAAVAAIGIDFGTDTICIGCARKGGVDILDNEVSNRLTPVYVGFGDKVRAIGESGLNEFARNPKNTVNQLKRFVGRSMNEPEVAESEAKLVAFNVSPGANGEIVATVTLAGEEKKFGTEALMGMMLTKLKEMIGRHAPGVKDLVLCVPGYFTAFQRQAVLDAGLISGVNIVQVFNEHAAAALAYGITKPDLTAEPRNVLIVDWGQANLSAAVCSFVKGKVEVLSTAFDRALGGRDLDKIIVDYFCEEFKAKTKVDLREKPKALVKLRAQCEKVKKTLSANTLATINMECLYEDFDLSSSMERDTLEELAAPLFQRILPTVDQALADSGLDKAALHSVEVIGSCKMIPSFRTALDEWFGQGVSTTLSATDAIAKGAALQAAILSPAFRVREFKVVDKTSYPITIVWQPLNATKEQADEAAKDPENVYDVFQRFNVLPSTKMLTFDKIEPFQLVAYYKNPELLPPGTPTMLGCFKVPSVPAPKEGKLLGRKIKVKAKLTLHGTLQLDTAQTWDEFEPEPEPEPEPPAEPAAPAEPSAGDEAKPMETDEAEKKEEGEKTEEEKKDGAEGEKKEEDKATEEPKEKKQKEEPKIKTVKSELSIIAEGCPGLAPDTLEAIREDERKMAAADELAVATDKAMNDLESYVLNTRPKLDDAWKDFVDDATKEAFSQQLGDAENWIYDHWDEKLEVYSAKLDELTAVGDKIKYRYDEAEKRPSIVQDTRNIIDQVRADAASGPEVEKFAHIEQAEKDKVAAECDRVTALLDSKLSEQDALPKSTPPCVTIMEIKAMGVDLQKFATPIMNKPKPKPKPEPKKEEPAEGEKKDGEDAAAAKEGDAATGEGDAAAGEGAAGGAEAAPDAPAPMDADLD